ncbi:spore germination protein [Cytobacillus firmus]|nr:spore germination protein [Cytobacillus firmus]
MLKSLVQFKKNKREHDKNNPLKTNYQTIDILIQQLKSSDDFVSFTPSTNENSIWISYFGSLVDKETLHRYVINKINNNLHQIRKIQDIKTIIPLEGIELTNDVKKIEEKVLKGHISIQLKQNDELCALVNLEDSKSGKRQFSEAENESTVVGPKVGFVESIDVNIGLLRKQITNSKLTLKEFTLGSLSKSKVIVAYIEGVANEQNINTMEQRLTDFDWDMIFDTSMIGNLIADNSNSIFPIFLHTERLDRVVWAMLNGQIAIFSDGSPNVVTGPSVFLDFFISPEDYYLPWMLGSAARVTRILGVVFSVFASSVYVAILTHHYQMIPSDLLSPLISSRANVPFPPIIEVLFLEVTIELLREAGARLPTKVGQTLGIVGGIVIGSAAVEAAVTSNVLLIIIALSALASFTTPIYKMSNTIRLLRFPLILSAWMFGLVGIVACLWFIIIHLIRLKSLGTPYLTPIYPPRRELWVDSAIRLDNKFFSKRPSHQRTGFDLRFNPKKAKEKKDIEE